MTIFFRFDKIKICVRIHSAQREVIFMGSVLLNIKDQNELQKTIEGMSPRALVTAHSELARTYLNMEISYGVQSGKQSRTEFINEAKHIYQVLCILSANIRVQDVQRMSTAYVK